MADEQADRWGWPFDREAPVDTTAADAPSGAGRRREALVINMAGAARKEGGGRRVAADEDVATAARRNLRAASAMHDMPGRDENAARDRPVDAPPRLQSRDHPDKEGNIKVLEGTKYCQTV